MARKWRYQCTQPMLPPDAESPVMDYKQMDDWLNEMDEQGWEFVGYAQTMWKGSNPWTQDWWIFRRPVPAPDADEREDE